MILVKEDFGDRVEFEETRSGLVFTAWLKGSTWQIVRDGAPQAGVTADVWGHVEDRDGEWWAYAGNLPDTEGVRKSTRNDAFEWVAVDRSAPDEDEDR
jgi:hypothetical protein